MPAATRYRLLDGARAGYMDPTVYVVQRWNAVVQCWVDLTGPLPRRVAAERLGQIMAGAH